MQWESMIQSEVLIRFSVDSGLSEHSRVDTFVDAARTDTIPHGPGPEHWVYVGTVVGYHTHLKPPRDERHSRGLISTRAGIFYCCVINSTSTA